MATKYEDAEEELRRRAAVITIAGLALMVLASVSAIAGFFWGWPYIGAAVIIFMWGFLFLAVAVRLVDKADLLTPPKWDVGDPDGRD